MAQPINVGGGGEMMQLLMMMEHKIQAIYPRENHQNRVISVIAIINLAACLINLLDQNLIPYTLYQTHSMRKAWNMAAHSGKIT